ncbi:MAG: adenine deaminase [Armatimonadetes bacterium]|nr:adenine deaminase [Armatimonadota bacterium]
MALDRLLSVACGAEPADIVLAGGTVVDVLSGALRRADVAVCEGQIAGVSEEGYAGRRVIDCTGRFVAPGLIDGHIHIESSLLSPQEFAWAVAAHGTTTVVADPHEIANVCGLDGVRYMAADARGAPCEVLLTAPSCVPATHLETSGAELGPREVAEMLRWPTVVGLGEMMNFPGVVAGDPTVLGKLASAAGRPIDGHAPDLSGKDLQAYVAAGPDSDHECTTLAEAREKLAAGMWIMVREGTAAQNLAALLPLAQDPTTANRCLLVSDDLAAHELAAEGHMDRILRRAVALGLDPVTALRLVTTNPAARFRLHDRGVLRPGLLADVVVFEDLDSFQVHTVLKRGREVSDLPRRRSRARLPVGSCRLRALTEASFRVPATGGAVRAIGVVPGQIVTRALRLRLPASGGSLQADPQQDVAKLAVIERHGRGGGIGLGFVKGLGLRGGAIGSTVAHDSHNLIIAGMDDRAMLIAAQSVAEEGGGFVAVSPEGQAGIMPLPIAGLMSERRLEDVVSSQRTALEAAKSLGSPHSDPYAILSFLALPVIPELRLTDRGLVDVTRFEHMPLTGDVGDG